MIPWFGPRLISAPKRNRLDAVDADESLARMTGRVPTLSSVRILPLAPPWMPDRVIDGLTAMRMVDAPDKLAGFQSAVFVVRVAGVMTPARSTRPSCSTLARIETVEQRARVGCGPPGLATQISLAPVPPPVPKTSVTSPLPPPVPPRAVHAVPFHQQTTLFVPPPVVHDVGVVESVTT